MKRKLTRALLAALSILMLLPSAALAAGSFDPPAQQSVSSNGTDGKEVIPVYGYIGKDTSIVDPDPTDPEKPIETEIYVEVPVKILFAAFESDAGAVTSPDYTISNLSTVSDIKVEIESFSQRNAVDLGGRLSLSLDDYAGSEIVPGVFPAAYPPAKPFAAALPKKTGGSSANILPFRVGGSWSGGFNAELHPVFDMVLKFTALPDAS